MSEHRELCYSSNPGYEPDSADSVSQNQVSIQSYIVASFSVCARRQQSRPKPSGCSWGTENASYGGNLSRKYPFGIPVFILFHADDILQRLVD
jgi:hypothetical protein